MPMNEYGEIIRNSSPPPPIPHGSDGNNNGNKGSGIYIILGIIILVIAIISIYNADSNKKKDQINATDANDDLSEEYVNSPYEEEQSEDEDWQYEDNNEINDNESTPGFYFPNSDSEYISYDDLQDMSEEEVCLALNEIYARRGRKFNTDWIREYFESQSWYNPIYEPEDFSDSIFNECEKENIDTIVKYQQDKGWR